MLRKISFFIFMIFVLITQLIQAQNKVIDLGDLSIEGDIRKPLIISLQSREESNKIQKAYCKKNS